MASWSERPSTWKAPTSKPKVRQYEVEVRNPACPRYTITERDHGGGEHMFEAKTPDGKRAGYISTFADHSSLQVMQSKVFADHRRCGLGTRLYEAAARYGCEVLKRPLRSDTARSVYSHTFWQKQAGKGRAICAEEATSTWAGGEAEGKDTIAYGRDRCRYFQMKCPVTSLEGRPSRDRGRSKRRR